MTKHKWLCWSLTHLNILSSTKAHRETTDAFLYPVLVFNRFELFTKRYQAEVHRSCVCHYLNISINKHQSALVDQVHAP